MLDCRCSVSESNGIHTRDVTPSMILRIYVSLGISEIMRNSIRAIEQMIYLEGDPHAPASSPQELNHSQLRHQTRLINNMLNECLASVEPFQQQPNKSITIDDTIVKTNLRISKMITIRQIFLYFRPSYHFSFSFWRRTKCYAFKGGEQS